MTYFLIQSSTLLTNARQIRHSATKAATKASERLLSNNADLRGTECLLEPQMRESKTWLRCQAEAENVRNIELLVTVRP